MALGKAIALAAERFQDKTDRGGNPYILHCLRVMNGVDGDEDVKSAAVLHDIVEDTEVSIRDLAFVYDFNHRVVATVDLLTHREGVSYDDYIKRISTCEIATAIKLADLRDNSDITRLKGLTKRDIDRMEKYHRAYTYLSKL